MDASRDAQMVPVQLNSLAELAVPRLMLLIFHIPKLYLLFHGRRPVEHGFLQDGANGSGTHRSLVSAMRGVSTPTYPVGEMGISGQVPFETCQFRIPLLIECRQRSSDILFRVDRRKHRRVGMSKRSAGDSGILCSGHRPNQGPFDRGTPGDGVLLVISAHHLNFPLDLVERDFPIVVQWRQM